MTIAEQTFEAQNEARLAQDRAWNYDGDGLDAERVRKDLFDEAKAAEQRAADLQALAGGVVYRPYTDFLPEIEKKIAGITRRAAKLGVEPPTLTFHETFIEERATGKLDMMGEPIIARYERQYIAVTGTAPKLAGYTFLAALQHEDAGTIVRKVPGTDEIDTTAYRNVGPECAHCRLDRRRKASYLVRHEATGEILQVGSTCIQDFLGGLSPQQAVKMFEWLDSIDGMFGGFDEEENYGPRVELLTDTEWFMTHVATMMRTGGWLSRSAAYDRGGIATSDAAASNMHDMERRRTDRFGAPEWVTPTDEDAARAKNAIAWVRETLASQDALSDYEHNLVVALASDGLRHKSFGIAASGIRAYERAMERQVEDEIKAKQREADSHSEWVGEIKQRLDLTLTVSAVYETEGYYGTTFVTKFHDEAGNVFTWFGSYRIEPGSTVEGKWTIKDHSEFKGTKETVLNRPKLREEVLA